VTKKWVIIWMNIKVLAITDLLQANTDGFKNFIKVSNTITFFIIPSINVPNDTKIEELSRRRVNATIKKIFYHWFSFKRRKFIVEFLNITESSNFVGFDPINFIYRKASRKKKIKYLDNKWVYHSLSLKWSNFPY